MTERRAGASTPGAPSPAGTAPGLPLTDALTPLPTRLIDGAQPVFDWLVRHLWHVTEHGRDLVPAGPVILAVNHVGALDGPFVVAITPRAHALTKVEMWNTRVVGWLLDRLGQVALDRRRPDPGALRRSVQVLRAGRRLVIFPEGHRGPENYERFKNGVAYLALVTGAPVVPVALVGTTTGQATGVEALPRPGARVHVVYGEPVVVEAQPWPRTAREVGDLAQRLRAICTQHVQQAHESLGLELHPRTTP